MSGNERVTVDCPDGDFVHIDYVRITADGLDMGGELWFARENLEWIVDTLTRCLDVYGVPPVEERRGDDLLAIFEAGPEQAPYVHLQNERDASTPHGGVYALAMRPPTARRLVSLLSALR